MSLGYRYFIKNKSKNNFTIVVDTEQPGVSNNDQFQLTGALGEYSVKSIQITGSNPGAKQNFGGLINQETITFANGPGVYELEIIPKSQNNKFRRIRFSAKRLSVETYDETILQHLLTNSNWNLGSSWTGDYINGFTRTSGTSALTNTISAIPGVTYFIDILGGISNGTVNVSFGGSTFNSLTSASNTTFTATNTNSLSITPSGNFSGTLNIRLRAGDSNKVLEIKQWGNVQWSSMLRAFSYCRNMELTTQDAPKFTNSVTDFDSLFEGCTTLTGLSCNWNWNTSNITQMSACFKDCTNFNGDVSNWNTSNVTQFGRLSQNNGMFAFCVNFNRDLSTKQVTTVENGTHIAWDVFNSTSFSAMFRGCSQFNGNIDNWRLNSNSSILFQNTFQDCVLFNRDISTKEVNVVGLGDYIAWDMFRVTNINSIISGNISMAFNQNIGNWNTTNMANIGTAFARCTQFNQDLSTKQVIVGTGANEITYIAWNISNVTNMGSTFANCSNFNGNIDNWNTSNVTTLLNIFQSANNSFNRDISTKVVSVAGLGDYIAWNTSNVTNMAGVFRNTNINVDVSNWNTSNVTTLQFFTLINNQFNQDISRKMITIDPGGPLELTYEAWNTANVTNFSSAFQQTNFNQDIGNWLIRQTGNVNMMSMFRQSVFNQDISGWDIRRVNNFDGFMASKTTANYSYLDNIYNAWSLLPVQSNLLVDFGTIQYTNAGASGKQILIDDFNWTITDGGEI